MIGVDRLDILPTPIASQPHRRGWHTPTFGGLVVRGARVNVLLGDALRLDELYLIAFAVDSDGALLS